MRDENLKKAATYLDLIEYELNKIAGNVGHVSFEDWNQIQDMRHKMVLDIYKKSSIMPTRN